MSNQYHKQLLQRLPVSSYGIRKDQLSRTIILFLDYTIHFFITFALFKNQKIDRNCSYYPDKVGNDRVFYYTKEKLLTRNYLCPIFSSKYVIKHLNLRDSVFLIA